MRGARGAGFGAVAVLLHRRNGGGGGDVASLTGRLARQQENLAVVLARLRAFPHGFHGLHVHETGSCERPSFSSAGGHFDRVGANHPNHAGDMPVVYVTADGTATAAFFTERAGRVRVRVAPGLDRLGCSTTARIFPARAGMGPALAGRAA